MLGVALSWGCWSGGLGTTAEVAQDSTREALPQARAEGMSKAIAFVPSVGLPRELRERHSMTVSAEGDSALPLEASTARTTPLETPALDAELQRLRRKAQERVLGRDYAAGMHALEYVPPETTSLPGAAALASPEPEATSTQAHYQDASVDSHNDPALDADTEDPLSSSPESSGASLAASLGFRPSRALGRFVAIEGESALEHFHKALERLSIGMDKDNKVRILAYGASHTQADVYPAYLRSYLQSRFGDGGQGFVLLGRVNRWQQNRSTRARQRGFTVRHARYRRDVQDEPLGLFGAALVGRHAGSFAEVVTPKDSANTQFEVHYFKEAGGGSFSVEVDGKTVAKIDTALATAGPAFRAFETLPGRRRIRVKLQGNGPVRLFGIIAETRQPGVVVDTLGISGAQMAANLAWHEDAWIEAVRHRAPDLVTFAYGTNESVDEGLSMTAYEQQLSAVLTRLQRALPLASCVLIAPFDLPMPTRIRLMKIIDVQRRVSRRFGCGFWNGHAFMGGEGSIRRWASAKPPLASTDYIHLTRLGYVYAGVAIGDALMRSYDLNSFHGSGFAGAAASPPPLLGISSPESCELSSCP